MSGTTEAFARVTIDALLTDVSWNLTDGSSVLFEYALPDGTQADYVLCDRQGKASAVHVVSVRPGRFSAAVAGIRLIRQRQGLVLIRHGFGDEARRLRGSVLQGGVVQVGVDGGGGALAVPEQSPRRWSTRRRS